MRAYRGACSYSRATPVPLNALHMPTPPGQREPDSLTQRPASRPEAGPSSPRKSSGKLTSQITQHTSPRKSPGKLTSPRKLPGKVARLLNAPCLAHLGRRVWGSGSSGFIDQGLGMTGATRNSGHAPPLGCLSAPRHSATAET